VIVLSAAHEKVFAQIAPTQKEGEATELRESLAKTQVVSSGEYGEVIVPPRTQLPVSDLATPFTAVVGNEL